MSQLDILDNRPVFQLKGGMVTATVLELTANNLLRFEHQLADKVAQAPQLFQGSPLILGLEKLGEDEGELDLAAILRLCRAQGLTPLGVKAARASDIAAAEALGLPLLPASRMKDKPVEVAEATPVAQAAPARPAPAAEARTTKVITQPVRGGQQIYAPGADLIVLAPVSAGAEVIADGHIHCYGILRGRALAGAQGDTEARVFCQQMEAELVAVAGHYHVAEELRKNARWGKSAQVSLTNGELNLAAL